MTATFPLDDSGRPSARIDHVGIVVRDLDAAIEYFGTQFGFEVEAREVIAAIGVESVFLSVSDGQTLQFLQPIAPGPLMTHLEERGQGAHHVCLDVPDIDGALRTLPGESGTRVVAGGRGRRTCFLTNQQFGFAVELCQSPVKVVD